MNTQCQIPNIKFQIIGNWILDIGYLFYET